MALRNIQARRKRSALKAADQVKREGNGSKTFSSAFCRGDVGVAVVPDGVRERAKEPFFGDAAAINLDVGGGPESSLML